MWRYLLGFLIAYVLGVAFEVWVATAVLCLGDSKFDGGCGGWDLYFMISTIVLFPAAAGAAVAGLYGQLTNKSRVLILTICLGILLAWLHLSWVIGIDEKASLKVQWMVLWACFATVRLVVGWLTRRRQRTHMRLRPEA